jgi:hypothetical protein
MPRGRVLAGILLVSPCVIRTLMPCDETYLNRR